MSPEEDIRAGDPPEAAQLEVLPLAVDPAPPAPAPAPAAAPRGRRLALLGAAALALLALLEAGVALTAPLRTPKAADWQRAADFVRSLRQPDDLIVFAPAWVEPLGRLYLGDQISLADAGRLDAARYGRIIEVAVRGGRAPEARLPGARLVRQARFGGVAVGLYEKPPARVVYDFLERWQEARVTRWRHGSEEAACALKGDRIQCPGIGFNHVAQRMLEPDYAPRRCLYVQPVDRAEMRLTFTAPLGRTLAGATGLHDYHQRKIADGKVQMRVLVDGVERLQTWQGSHDGWKPFALETAGLAGGPHEVTFVISSPKPYARHFCFAAEARE
jgi:hypothetical protein